MTRKTVIVLILAFLAACSSWGQGSIPKVKINYVSVVPATNDVKINWAQSTDINVKGYIIYRYDPVNDFYRIIDTVTAKNIVNFTNLAVLPATSTSSEAGLHSETYSLTAYDSLVGAESELADDHRTVFLKSVFDSCRSEIKLSWTAYSTWFNGVANYKIWYSIDNGSSFNVLETLNGDIQSFNVRNLLPDINYSFYIEAFGGGTLKSTSNMVSEFTDMPRPPIEFNANYASVLKENYIEVSFTIDTTADVNRYELLRADTLDGDFDIITEFTPGPSTTEIKYTDYAPTGITHYYKLQAINTCDVPFANTTNYASNIVLTATAENNMRNKLVWTNYFKWRKGIHHYDVYRVVDYMDPVMIAQVPYGDTTHTDRMDQFLYDPQLEIQNPFLDIENPYNYLEQPVVSGLVCYYVIGIEKPGTEEDYRSVSNKFCVSQMPRVFVPSAFTPNSDGLNDLFFPYISLAGLRDYELRIYNRWGNLVFRTVHLHQGWNGTMYDGTTRAPIGTYVYKFTFNDGDGENHKYSGQVTIVR